MSFPTKIFPRSAFAAEASIATPTITDMVDNVDALSISVSCEKIADTPNPCYKFTALMGDVSYEHTLTVGPVDGDVILPSIDDLQLSVDTAREYAAKHCHMRFTVKELESQIV